MNSSNVNISILLAVISFIIPIVFKILKKQDIQLSDVARCTLAAMGLPNLIICLFLLITNTSKAMEMGETPQYLTIAVLIIIYLAIKEIKQIFEKEENTS